MSRTKKVSAHIIKKALSKKHIEDLFLTEVKNGSTWNNPNLCIMDALAIKKSWAKPLFTGYEIKVSRNDFVQDDKWHNYLNYCHVFYFVCPNGIIKKEELPEKVGLIYYNPEKDSLWTAKKAFYRDIEISADMLYYILLSKISSDRHPFFSSEREMIEEWVKDKRKTKELAYSFKSKLVKELNEALQAKKDIELDANRYKKDSELLQEVKSVMNEFGIKTFNWCLIDDLREALSNKIPYGIEASVKRIEGEIKNIKRIIEEVNKRL